ncbi:hypothetical protein CH275_07595 [Rhodococcus sp. 06-235-1A]|uniref:hypothetical protein n=1 Tax=Rhodococcus sp. 06-235-1A TaxID=2022508 RepID=UPI000B9A6236|nr:hypothetical protein [Rhodococcus sp. 06-235-1A]OZD07348.1 hypothetical protein CH275_07595 [Rhodococcus sp. 06-235-1A]
MKRGGARIDAKVIAAASDRGLVRTAKLLELGVASKTIVRRTLPDGIWSRALPGLVFLTNRSLTQLERATAVSIYCGSDAVISGRAGLALHGLLPPGSFEETFALIPEAQHRKSVGFAAVERTWRMPPPEIKSGLRVAPVVRCLCDAVRRMKNTEQCMALIARVVQRGAATVDAIMKELNAGSTRGTAMPRRVLRELATGAHSVAEAKAQKLYGRSGLPAMHHNVAVYDEQGKFLLIADNWLDDVALDWEIDSLEYHLSPADHRATVERRERAQNAGLIVVTHLPSDIRDNPERVLSDLRARYEQARARPRPNVTMRPTVDRTYRQSG